jgi:hypothetical protein
MADSKKCLNWDFFDYKIPTGKGVDYDGGD